MGMADSCTCPVCLWRHVAHGRPCVCGGILHMPAPLPNTASFGSRRAPTALVDKHLVGGRRGGPCTFAKRGERRRPRMPRAILFARGGLIAWDFVSVGTVPIRAGALGTPEPDRCDADALGGACDVARESAAARALQCHVGFRRRRHAGRIAFDWPGA